MYASQTKRLCVRGAAAAASDETRVQHHSSSSATSEASLVHQQQQPQQQQQQTTTTTTSANPQQPTAPALPSSSSSSAPSCAQNTRGAKAFVANMTASATGAPSDENESPKKTSNAPLVTTLPQTRPPPTAILSVADGAGTNESSVGNSEDLSPEQRLINELANEALEETKLELLLSIRNLITACNKRKDSLVGSSSFSKVVQLIEDDSFSHNVKTQLALLLCSIAKGGERNVEVLNESLVDEKIFNLMLCSQDDALIEACLRCIRSIMSWPKASRAWILYEVPGLKGRNKGHDNFIETSNLRKIIAYAQASDSLIVQECVADIFALTCNRNKDQIMLFKASALPCIVQLLESPSYRVKIAALNWLVQICLKNHLVSSEAIKTMCPSGSPCLDRLTQMMNKDECIDLQFLSAKCFAHIYRALATDTLKDDSRIVNHVLPTLVRMIHRDKRPQLRCKAAECLAYLIEHETRLQNIASTCDRLVESLANMLDFEQNPILAELESLATYDPRWPHALVKGSSCRSMMCHQSIPSLDLRMQMQSELAKFDGTNDMTNELSEEMKRTAFLALATLASNLEPIRRKIFNTCTVMQHLVRELNRSDAKVSTRKTLQPVLTCLLSLSRSVRQLRTNFAENSIYGALKNLLSTKSQDVLILVLAILCNISLDFSTGKQYFLDVRTIEILCNLTKGSDSNLRLHGIWILMNMVYQLKDQNLKFQILKTLGINHVLNLLEVEGEEELVLKTLGFLRNLLSQRAHIDAIMSSYGKKIMQSLTRLLERPTSSRIKEQTLCVLTNIADGTDSKSLIMSNRGVLGYLACTICDEYAGDLRIAAICCITNLALKEQDGSYERRDEMKKFGIEEKLKAMLNTSDPILSDRVRTAYNQFLIGIDDKCVN